jgi:mannose-6-phosphate isomerase-like protein (cupin superfamily)
MKASKIANEVFAAGNQGNDQWFEVTPGERFRIRTSTRDTKGIYTMLEVVADPRNGVPMHIHQNEDEHFVVLEGSLHVANGDKRFDAPAGTTVTIKKGVSCLVQSDGYAAANAGRFFAWKHRRFVQSNRRARER